MLEVTMTFEMYLNQFIKWDKKRISNETISSFASAGQIVQSLKSFIWK